MKKKLLYLFLSAFVIASCNNAPKDSKEAAENANEARLDHKMEDDAEFVVDAADDGMLEVQLAELARTKSSSAVIKEMAVLLIADHSLANDELKALAIQKNITLPTGMGEKNQKTYNDMNQKTGADFDNAYADLMVDDHQHDIKEFKKAADDCKDADIKAWAAGKVPALEHHLEVAKNARAAH